MIWRSDYCDARYKEPKSQRRRADADPVRGPAPVANFTLPIQQSLTSATGNAAKGTRRRNTHTPVHCWHPANPPSRNAHAPMRRRDSTHSINSKSSHRGNPRAFPQSHHPLAKRYRPRRVPPLPITPIMPVFSVPSRSTPNPSTHDENRGVEWDASSFTPIPRTPIIRSNAEDALLPRRQKGHDFRRRSVYCSLEEREGRNAGLTRICVPENPLQAPAA